MLYKAAMLTKPGGRKKNEDYAAFAERNGSACYVVADGLTTHVGGDLASMTACESLLEAFRKSPGCTQELLKKYLEYARQSIITLRDKLGSDSALKTTLVVLLISENTALWAHIGNSRLYYFKQGQLAFQTKDQSLPQRLADIGEITYDQIRFHEDHSRLISVFDGGDINRFTFLNKLVQISQGESFLLCSDGFWEYVFEAEMAADLATAISPASWIAAMEKRLLQRAKENHDNYAVLAVMVK